MIVLVNFFLRKKTLTTANIAKERLQIIVAERKIKNKLKPNDILQLKNDLLTVICKYIHNPQMISIQFKKKDENVSILNCDIFFPNEKK